MRSYEESWPADLNATFSKDVETMVATMGVTSRNYCSMRCKSYMFEGNKNATPSNSAIFYTMYALTGASVGE